MKKGQVSIVLVAAICLILILHVNYLRFVCDDAFISFRYAKNFVEGNGLVYNLGERVEGYTNFLWTLLLGVFMKIGLDAVAVSQVLGVLFSLATVFVLLRLNRRLYPADNLFNYLAPLFLVCCGAYAAWSTGGLETSFFTFLVFLGAFFFISGMTGPKHLALSGLAFTLACMARPDGLVFAGVTFLFLCYQIIFSKTVRLRNLWVWSVPFLLPFLAYFLWRWSYYGDLLPNTFYVKMGGRILLDRGLVYLFDFIGRFWIWLMVIPLLFLGKSMRLNRNLKMVIPYFTSLILVFSCYVAYVGGDFMDMFRFLVPVLPFFFFLAQEGFRGMFHHYQPLCSRKQRMSLIASQILLTGLAVFLLARPSRESNKVWSRENTDSIGMLREYTRVWSKVGLMFKDVARPKESLATTAAGAIPYYSELYAIDQLGLTFPSPVALKDRMVKKAGHVKKVSDEFLLSLRPTYVLEHPNIYDEFDQTRGVWVSGELFLRNGYKAMVFPVNVSENETKYLYCFSLKGSRSEKIDGDASRAGEPKATE
jgi:arabinofuranosyltransferase